MFQSTYRLWLSNVPIHVSAVAIECSNPHFGCGYRMFQSTFRLWLSNVPIHISAVATIGTEFVPVSILQFPPIIGDGVASWSSSHLQGFPTATPPYDLQSKRDKKTYNAIRDTSVGDNSGNSPSCFPSNSRPENVLKPRILRGHILRKPQRFDCYDNRNQSTDIYNPTPRHTPQNLNAIAMQDEIRPIWTESHDVADTILCKKAVTTELNRSASS
jgi:hypothetical protein